MYRTGCKAVVKLRELFTESGPFSVAQVSCIYLKFSLLSDYSVNLSKSTLLPITENSWNPADQNLDYPLPTGNIKYLGINISPKLSELVHLNFTPLLDKICGDLRRWNYLPISLLWRSTVVKMKILP